MTASGLSCTLARFTDTEADEHGIVVPRGHSMTLVGPAGSGKSAFCRLICGLSDASSETNAAFDGVCIRDLPDHERATLIGYVPTNPSLLFSGMKDTVRGELALSLRLLGRNESGARERLDHVVGRFALKPILARDPFTLSGGEATRLAIALVVVKSPNLLVLDQIYDHLDPQMRVSLQRSIHDCLPADAVVIETQARSQSASEKHATIWLDWRIEIEHREAALRRMTSERCNQPTVRSQAKKRLGDVLLNAEALEHTYSDSKFKLGPLTLRLFGGECVALTGPNGSGKTTLLKGLAQILPAQYRDFCVRKPNGTVARPLSKRLHEWAHSVLYCFQNPDDQLYLATVRQEIVETARRTNTANRELVERITNALDLDQYLDESPFDLPYPVRRLVSVASALAAQSPVLLLDEPSAGLDDRQSSSLIRALNQFRPDDSAMLIVSHDAALIAEVATRCVTISDLSGTTQEESPQTPAKCPMHS